MRSMVEGRAQRENGTRRMLPATGKSYRQARALRRTMSLPEALLWRHLRKRQTGFHWRKQHPAGPYQLDIYCDVAKLCV